MPLKMADVANLFVRLRRAQARAAAQHIDSTSGDWPLTHAALADDVAMSPRKVPLVQEDTFVCKDGVDVAKLLRLARAALYEEAQVIGANVLVDEQWTCRICLHRNDPRMFTVHIRYSASASRSQKRDPQQPIALDCARSIPGLMTILDRLEQ